jgi:hypothetical protein
MFRTGEILYHRLLMPDASDNLGYDPAIYGGVEEEDGPLAQPALPTDDVIRLHLLELCRQRSLDRTAVPQLIARVREVVRGFIEERGDRIIDRFTFSEALTVAQQQIGRGTAE